jgi:hypothetical protein
MEYLCRRINGKKPQKNRELKVLGDLGTCKSCANRIEFIDMSLKKWATTPGKQSN